MKNAKRKTKNAPAQISNLYALRSTLYAFDYALRSTLYAVSEFTFGELVPLMRASVQSLRVPELINLETLKLGNFETAEGQGNAETLYSQHQICKKFLQFVSLVKLKNMEALRIEILNPKVKTILKQLADLDLIAISKMESPETELKNLLKKFRSKSKEAPTMDEITREVEVVRAERYAGKKD